MFFPARDVLTLTLMTRVGLAFSYDYWDDALFSPGWFPYSMLAFRGFYDGLRDMLAPGGSSLYLIDGFS